MVIAMAGKNLKFEEIEREGYLAALRGESKSSHVYFDKNRRMAFEAGYYRGTIEAARKLQEKKEAENGR